MKIKQLNRWFLALLLVVIATTSVKTAFAEVKEVRLAKQYGLSYLPLIMVEENKLIEKYAKIAGVGTLKTTWVTLGSGAAMNDALLSGSVDYISGGVAPFLTLWAKTKGNVKGVTALDTTPLYLNTANPAVKSIKDFTDKDRIALPAVKVSIQAVVLQMAAAKIFGFDRCNQLDRLTVSMSHPDGAIALLSGKSEITAHFTAPPYSFQELEKPNVRTVLNSYDVLGGPHTFNVVSATKSFYENNPQTYAIVYAAIEEAIAAIKKDKKAAAELYVKATKSKESVESILAQLNNPQIGYRAEPLRITKFSDFLFKIGSIDLKPKNEKELFFPKVRLQKGQ